MNRACFPHEKHQNSQKWAKFMNFSFWPCLWFGLPGRLLITSYLSRTKNQPKEEVFGTDVPQTSGGHSRGYPGPKLRSGRSKSWKNKHFGVDIHDPKGRTSTTLRDFQKLRSEKLWAEFSFPNLVAIWLALCNFKKSFIGASQLRQRIIEESGQVSDWTISLKLENESAPNLSKSCPESCP